MAMRWRPRLRTIFFTVNVLIITLPFGGVVLLRLYESVLIRRTEIELVVQGAHVAASYLSAVQEELERDPGVDPSSFGVDAKQRRLVPNDQLHPVEPKLDLAADPILPPPVAARPSSRPPDQVSVRAGERITQAMRIAQKVTLAGIRVVDAQGVVVATTRTELGLSLAHREEVRRALDGEFVALMRARVSDEPPPPLDSISRGTQLRVFVAIPVIDGGRVLGAVILSRTPQAVGQSLFAIRWYILAGAFAILAMIALITLLTSRTITLPLEELIRQSERVARGEKGAATPLARSGTLEVRRVSEAIASMAQALEERADYINTFARGVSHEFKTPLASMRGAVELLRDHVDEMTPEERDTFLGNVEQDTERLTRLVSRLTDLARADVIKPAEDTCKVTPVIMDVADRFRNDGLSLEVDLDAQVNEVRIARETLESIMTNLLDNARQHGGADASVSMRTSLVDTDLDQADVVVIEVEDDGPGISEANQKRVFDRFFTTARNRGGSGLGLNIVKKLVDVHNGDIALESEPGRTVFRFTLPAIGQPQRASRA